jgi:hypothetical protein
MIGARCRDYFGSLGLIYGLPLDSLPWLGVEKIRTGVVDRSQPHALRFAGHTADSRGFGTAINHL